MYSDRLRILTKAYRRADQANKRYNNAVKSRDIYIKQSEYLGGLNECLKVLSAMIAGQEEQWQHSVLKLLEAEIMQDLAYIYPSDGYQVTLSTRILRGKIRVDAKVQSYFSNIIPGDVADTQGRLFQQVVSFAALIGIMKILGVETVYVDEAFSGASKQNVVKINALLRSFQERGFNIILIAQDTSMAAGMEANTLLLSRSLDNKTQVQQIRG